MPAIRTSETLAKSRSKAPSTIASSASRRAGPSYALIGSTLAQPPSAKTASSATSLTLRPPSRTRFHLAFARAAPDPHDTERKKSWRGPFALDQQRIRDERYRSADGDDQRHRQGAFRLDPAHRGARHDAGQRLARAKQGGRAARAIAERRQGDRRSVGGDQPEARDGEKQRHEHPREAGETGERTDEEHRRRRAEDIYAPAEHSPRPASGDQPAVELGHADEAERVGAEIPAELLRGHAEKLDEDERRGGKIGKEGAERCDEHEVRPEKAPVARQRQDAGERMP